MLRVHVADEVLSALETLAHTSEVRGDQDLELFELNLIDSLAAVELLVLLSDRLGIQLSPAELDRNEWATPRKIIAYLEARLAHA
jgi:D-alanine--poly(phosphoribitol) ligase subunit 2